MIRQVTKSRKYSSPLAMLSPFEKGAEHSEGLGGIYLTNLFFKEGD
ncbi:MAG: hypothetical protein RIR39_623 [Pseudomonadota bacterium]